MGNFVAAKHVEFVKRILDRRGLGGDRINMYHCSGAESVKFVKSIEDSVSKIEKLGLNPIKTEQATLQTGIEEIEKKIKSITPT
jgi:F420-non-reducing hydrogenase iron-sulfur subunit